MANKYIYTYIHTYIHTYINTYIFPEETAGIVKETEMETVGRCGHVVTT